MTFHRFGKGFIIHQQKKKKKKENKAFIGNKKNLSENADYLYHLYVYIKRKERKGILDVHIAHVIFFLSRTYITM